MAQRDNYRKKVGLLIDLTKCIGCRGCQVACKRWNHLPYELTHMRDDWTNPSELSAKTWTHIQFNLDQDGGNGLRWHFVKRQCFHCKEPACVAACLVGALYKSDEGPVLYDEQKCMGCRYCMMACPFQMSRFEWDKALPLIKRCTLCADRISAGLKPACASTCPTRAILFGPRDELLQEAQARLQNQPEKYVNHIYGEREIGGTSVLYLSDVPFEDLGFRADLGHEPLPAFTWKALSRVPTLVLFLGVLLGASWLITQKRGKDDKNEGK